jgi:hypothetical protein
MATLRGTGWDRFNSGYGVDWEGTKRRARQSRWTRKRCFWCRSRSRIEWHHLTYSRAATPGKAPLWVLRPMCHRCHAIETWLCRALFSTRQRHGWAHAWVTYGVRWLTRGLVLLALYLAAAYVGIV